MRLILIYLTLLVGVNQILASIPYLPWYASSYAMNGNFYGSDYSPFRPNTNADLYKFSTDDSSEESEEDSLKPFTQTFADDLLLNHFFDSFMVSVQPTDEGNVDGDNISNGKNNSDGVGDNNDDDDDNDDDEEHKEGSDNEFLLHLSGIFGSAEQNSSEEKNNVDKEQEEMASSRFEETANSSSQEYEKDDERNSDVDISNDTDATKSLEENSDIDSNASMSEKDTEDAKYAQVPLYPTGAFLRGFIESREYEKEKKRRAELQLKKFNDNLELSINMVNKRIDDLHKSTVVEEAYDKDNDYNDDNDDNDYDIYGDEHDETMSFTFREINNTDDSSDINDSTTTKYESAEEDDNTSTATNGSDESTEVNKDNSVDEKNNSNASDSNETDSHETFFVFHGIDEANNEQDLNDHRYEVIESSSPKFHPTSAPSLVASMPTSRLEDLKLINQYSDIRANLDAQQSTLQTNENNLDKDFYTLINSNYDEESMKKFENDIYVVHEDLDRIKRNINAMQNFQSKLYLQKVITAAVQNAQHQLNN